MLWYRERRSGPKETRSREDKFKRSLTKGCISGEENRDIINKAKWRTRFIGIRQYSGGRCGQDARAKMAGRATPTKPPYGRSVRESRHVESVIGCNILNRFLELGRCKSETVL